MDHRRCIPLGDYAYCAVSINRNTARETCAALKGRVVILDTKAESDALTGILKGFVREPFWLALSDEKQEGAWVWDNGQPLTYENWHKAEPNDSGGHEDCAAAYWGGSPRWNDIGCTHKMALVCEFGDAAQPGKK